VRVGVRVGVRVAVGGGGGTGVRVAVTGTVVGVGVCVGVAVGGTGVFVGAGVSVGVGVCVGVGVSVGTGVGVCVGVAVGGTAVFVGVAAAIVMVTEALPWRAAASVPRSVMTCVPGIRLLDTNDVPVPRTPGWMLDRHNIWLQQSGPRSGSIAVPLNWIGVPGANTEPFAGEVIVTTGGLFTPAAAVRGLATTPAARTRGRMNKRSR
jgi:hypothetical protein